MKISIAVRMRPFSHEPGTRLLLPRTCCIVEAFPALIRIGSIEVRLPLSGPVREFTVQQDLEKGCILISGVAKEGRFRLRLQASRTAIELVAEKGPVSSCAWPYSENMQRDFFEPPLVRERLSLGSHRAQDWEAVRRRFDLREILPVLFHLSQWTPPVIGADTPMLRLLDLGFEPFLRAGFSGILAPRLTDEEHQGILRAEHIPIHASPCALISEARRRIRALFIEQTSRSIALSPGSFEYGRMTDLHLPHIGTLDVEWSKKRIHKAILRAKATTSISLEIAKPVHSYRLRTSMHEKGRRLEKGEEWECQEGKIYYLDRFQK